MRIFKKKLTTLNNNAAQKALQKPATLKPLTNVAAIENTNPLMTSVKNPRDRTLSGNVSIISIGRKNIFKRASTNDATTTVRQLSTLTPATTCVTIESEIMLMTNFKIKFFIRLLFLLGPSFVSGHRIHRKRLVPTGRNPIVHR